MPQALSREEFLALSELAKARRSVLVNTFSGTRLSFSTTEAFNAGRKLVRSGKKVYSASSQLATGTAKGGRTIAAAVPAIRSAAEEFIAECAGVDNLSDVVEAITSEALTELIAEITPFIGIARSAHKLATTTKKVVEGAHNLYNSGDYIAGFRVGDPVAAATAVQSIIKRDLTRHSIDLGRHSVATGTKLAGLFADLGTGTTVAVGLGNAVAAIGLQLAFLGIDIKQMQAGNKRLQSPQSLDLSIFSECPILGCYLLVNVDTSSVANFFVADIGLPNWMDRVEEMKAKQMDPMLKIATKAIGKSRLQLEGLASDKGTHKKKDFYSNIRSRMVKALRPP